MLSRHKVTFIACFGCMFPFMGITLTGENSCEFYLHSAVLLCVRGDLHLSSGSGHQHGQCLMYLHGCSPQCTPCYLHLTAWECSLREGCLPYCLHSGAAIFVWKSNQSYISSIGFVMLASSSNRRVQLLILSSSDANRNINSDKMLVNKQQ